VCVCYASATLWTQFVIICDSMCCKWTSALLVKCNVWCVMLNDAILVVNKLVWNPSWFWLTTGIIWAQVRKFECFGAYFCTCALIIWSVLLQLRYQCARSCGAITRRERQYGRKSQRYRSVTPTYSRGMSHLKSRDEIPMRGEDCNIPVFQNPKITTEKIFANMPMFGECHIGKTPM
jgi:hypothetical protein